MIWIGLRAIKSRFASALDCPLAHPIRVIKGIKRVNQVLGLTFPQDIPTAQRYSVTPFATKTIKSLPDHRTEAVR
jgi:hypothetical protein